jgi:antirestriction protein ArdC
MKTQEIFKKIQDKIIHLMKTEGADWHKPWTSKGAPINFITKKPYRGMNNFWLSVQDFSTNEWATFKQWSEKGYKIKKGSKATSVVFCEVKDKKPEWLEGKELETYQATGKLPKYFLWKNYAVFNGDQIEDFVSSQTVNVHSTELTEETVKNVDWFISNTKAIIENGQDSAFYSPLSDHIGMPAKEMFDTDVDYYSTLLHELTHWTGHKDRCNRDQANRFGTEEYAKEELIAEVGSAFLCKLLGVEKTVREDHAKYLNSWITIIQNESKAMVRAFSQAQKAIDYLEQLQLQKKEVA